MALAVHNLFRTAATAAQGEEINEVLANSALRIEQIISHGRSSPPGFWYDQPEPEWVVLLKGSATLLMAEEERVSLAAGDYLLIPARVLHRVEQVSGDALWLAVHFRQPPPDVTS